MSIAIKVVTVKGQVGTVSAFLDDTVEQLKYQVSGHLHGQKVADLKLSYMAKYLVNGSQTLRQCGFGKNKKGAIEQVMVSARSVGRGHRNRGRMLLRAAAAKQCRQNTSMYIPE